MQADRRRRDGAGRGENAVGRTRGGPRPGDDAQRQRPVPRRARADGPVPGVRAVLHGGEHQEGHDDGHDRRAGRRGRRRRRPGRRGRRGRGAHVQHGGRRVLHRAQVRDAVPAVRQRGRGVRGDQQRGERAGDGRVRVLRPGAGRRVPRVRVLQPVHAGRGPRAPRVPGRAQQHRGGHRVLQGAVADVPRRGARQAAAAAPVHRVRRTEAGQLPARLLARQRVAGRVQPQRVPAAARLAGRAQGAGQRRAVLRAGLPADRAGVRAHRGGQPVRAGARTQHRHDAARVPRQNDAQQLRHAGGGDGRGDGRPAGAGRHEDRVQPAGRHGAGQGGPHAHQLLRRRERVAGTREVRAPGAGHHRPEPGTRVRPDRVLQPRQRHTVLVETHAGHHQADTQVARRLPRGRHKENQTVGVFPSSFLNILFFCYVTRVRS